MSRTVRLRVYDLSNGLARAISLQLLGKQIDGIWHTGVVVNGVEYFFGQGIQRCHVGDTPFGSPVEEIDLGQTEVPDEMIEDFLRDIAPRFNASTYNLLSNNCNNFSDELAQFLVGAGIPKHITALPDEVAATPFGQMVIPMLQPALQERLSHATSAGFGAGTSPAASTIAAATVDAAQAPGLAAAGRSPDAAVPSVSGATPGAGSEHRVATTKGSSAVPESLVSSVTDAVEPGTSKSKQTLREDAAQSLGVAGNDVQRHFNDALHAEFRRLQAQGWSDANKAGAEAMRLVMEQVRDGRVLAPA